MLKPVNNQVFVKPDRPIEKKGALFIPPSDSTQSHGVVLASACETCKVGDRILYTRFFPTTFVGEDVIVVDGKSIIGVDDAPVIDEATASQPVSKEAGPGLLVAKGQNHLQN